MACSPVLHQWPALLGAQRGLARAALLGSDSRNQQPDNNWRPLLSPAMQPTLDDGGILHTSTCIDRLQSMLHARLGISSLGNERTCCGTRAKRYHNTTRPVPDKAVECQGCHSSHQVSGRASPH
ncbi:uncharacterized protein F5Z01DRAFT_231823 [Emericellopsis atlantica]|uniref:Uncharacterized protein n=1 Tax=Emericellopsis atlantica TaxID=2614577 RepID=A0A9P8CMI8_9HYPO|nr:uncharacterized protein F5Z01DRAFT_231823 [Emericellopsis atlantica]KAG9252493.1 hypothetical protein F5Z01DRAFT_231823 [Emericellopsis atlantica]